MGRNLAGLPSAIEDTPGGGLLIGAAVKNTALAAHRAVRTRYPLLSRAIVSGASAWRSTEETQFEERNGRIVNPSLAEYHVPVHPGARGIGEIGITGTGAAIANAVYNACGKRVRDFAITLDKLA